MNITILFSALFLVTAGVYFFVIKFVGKRNRERIAKLTDYLEQVNLGASGTIIQMQEDAFSHLQDEIYKTVTMLYNTRKAAIAAGRAVDISADDFDG